MSLMQSFKRIRSKLHYGFIVEWYNFWYIVLRKKHKVNPQIATIDETIRQIVENKCSISRFGDGEILLTSPHKELGFQKGNSQLAERLKEVLTSNDEKLLICLPDTFYNLSRYNRKSRRFWRTHFFIYGSWWDNYLSSDRLYYNSFLSRPYMDYASKKQAGKWFTEMKEIWKDRNIIFIEGEKSRLGVGNDLFDNAKSIRRILCPPQNAFDKYNEILAEAKKNEKDVLFMISLGPTATIMAYDLFKAGYQAIDSGHIDIEYEWWKIRATKKIKLASKYVNEASGGDKIEISNDEEYQKQIIAYII